MKNKFFKRTLSAFLAVVMVFLMVPFAAITAFAEESVNSEDYIERYRLEIINGVSNEGLVTYVSSQFNQMNIESGVDQGKSTTQKVLGATAKYGKVIGASCKILNFIPYVNVVSKPIGEIAGAIGEISGEFVEDNSTDILMAQLKEMQSEIGEKIKDIEAQIKDLSDEQRENLGKLATYFSSQTDLKLYQRELLDFSEGSTFGEDSTGDLMDYYDWKYLLCDKFNALLAAIKNDNPDLQSYYDDLYVVANRSNVLYSYLTDGADASEESRWGDISLQETMYRYYILNKHSPTGSYNDADFQLCIEECIEYANDWYSTYELSQMCLNICYTYQLQQLIDMYSAENIDADAKYYVYNDTRISISLQKIQDFLLDPQKELDDVTNEMAEFYARILNLDESYIYEANIEDADDLIFKVQYQEIVSELSFETHSFTDGLGKYYSRKNNTVNVGNTLYLNVMPEVFNNIFDAKLFKFESSNPSLATVNNAGVVNVIGSSGNFTVTLKYNGHTVYYLDFIVSDTPFSGGMGTKDAPYILSTWDDIKTLADKTEYHSYTDINFILVKDINAESDNFAGITSFSGNFDGNGHSIYNFKIDVDDQMAVGFFNTLNKTATVKNLTLGSADFNSLEDHSIYIMQDFYWLPTSSRDVYVGALAGNNLGIIDYCKVINAYVNGYRYCDLGKNHSMYTVVGGIAGVNSNKIIGCEVSDSYIYGTSHSPAKGDHSGTTIVEVGGIAGVSCGSIKNTGSYYNEISGWSEASASTSKSYSVAYLRVGGMVGYSAPETSCQNCYSYGNNLNSDKCIARNAAYPCQGPFCALNDGADLNTCYEERMPIDPPEDTNDETITWNITEYIEGETHFKNTQWNAESAKNETIIYPLSTHRIDTSNVGKSQVVILESITDTSMYKKSIAEITVVEKQIEEFILFAKPFVTSYKLNETVLNLEGLILLARYNNGTAKFLSNGGKGEVKEYSETFDFSAAGKSTVTFEYEGLTETMDVDVVCYHDNIILVGATNATCNDVGYTSGTFCNDCKIYISGHEEIPVLSSHPFGDWTKYNDTQHSRACACGEVEYADHNFGDWTKHNDIRHSRSCACGEVKYADHNWSDKVVTTPATHLDAGEWTQTCSDCGATETGVIDPDSSSHTFGDWVKYNDTQHSRACACGEVEYKDHDWDSEIVTVNPTYTAVGELTKTCTACGATEKEEIPPLPIPEDASSVVVDSTDAAIGRTVTVKINLKDNTGITSMRINVAYDSTLLRLTGIEYNASMGGQSVLPENIGALNGNVVLYWVDGFANYEDDGVFATLTFDVSGAVAAGTTTKISVTYDADDVYDVDEHNVALLCVDGIITFVDHTSGDINGDGEVNTKDTTRLMRYLAGWDVEVNEAALDVNGDGDENTKDTTRLMRYLAGWDVEIH